MSTHDTGWTGLGHDQDERSSTEDLAWTVRAVHRREHDPDSKLYCKAALSLRRIKGASNATDPWVWATLAERLVREGHPVNWMFRAVAMPESVERNRGRIRAIYNNAFGDVAGVETIDDVEELLIL